MSVSRWWRPFLVGVRWFYGLGWIVLGFGGICAVPFLAARGDWGWIYMLIGGAVIASLGFAVHPWTMSRWGAVVLKVVPARWRTQ